ncbi:MAG: MarR family transcriptional regulator [Propionibacteriaceae bacterium]|jgi:DNA-binding MarR family transcriptional regulator|nr:MarR family transcriptional regulator [Propionibacteriaceae bacterium]
MESQDFLLNEEETRIWRSWLFGFEYMEALINRALQKHGIDSSEYRVLALLSESPEQRLRMSDVANGVNRTPSRLSHMVTRMETRDLVERQPAPTDRRGAFLVLTANGKKVLDEAVIEHAVLVRQAFIDVVGVRDFNAVGRAMGKVLQTSMPEQSRRVGAQMWGWWPTIR